ncbi:hypothetical protein [Actinophytocola sp.]|uniref:hypothetical protein n=1 Tax=Actinophytocola sp. TaxID=1872138 RepID=UPI002D3858E5|nr:hypothetical protein [Actinophytocola sp.]HYQ69083.1 hypothetical protein [Actinophytocola sp.]
MTTRSTRRVEKTVRDGLTLDDLAEFVSRAYAEGAAGRENVAGLVRFNGNVKQVRVTITDDGDDDTATNAETETAAGRTSG